MKFFQNLFKANKPQTLEEFFNIDFDNIPDDTFSYEAEVNSKEEVTVRAKKKLNSNILNLFDKIEVVIFSCGKIQVYFINSHFTLGQHSTFNKTIKKLYDLLGADKNGNHFITREIESKLNNWSGSSLDMILIKWQNISRKISILASPNNSSWIEIETMPSNASFIANAYYNPNVKLTSNNILIDREKKLNDTRADFVYDEFSDEKGISITRLAGEEKSLIYTFAYRDYTEYTPLDSFTQIAITFGCESVLHQIVVVSFDNNIQLLKGDTITFLFEDGSKVEVMWNSESSILQNGGFYNIEYIDFSDMLTFKHEKFKKWQIISKKGRLRHTGGFINNNYTPMYKGEREGQYLLQVMADKVIGLSVS